MAEQATLDPKCKDSNPDTTGTWRKEQKSLATIAKVKLSSCIVNLLIKSNGFIVVLKKGSLKVSLK